MAIKQLVIDVYGQNGWQEVKQEANLKDDYFELLSVYNDEITYNIIQAATNVSGKTSSEILELFGQYWIDYASKAGYEPLLKLFGPNFKDCLKNLNRMHEHMGAMMPGLIPPEFEVVKEISDKEFELVYKSQRKGLSPMVKGLLIALASRYGINGLQIKEQNLDERNTHRFEIKWI